jgi:5-methylcytosine-specific restriction endonuclease McrA
MVFVLDKHQKPLMPCSEKRARLLMERGRAVVHRMEPFTIRLKDRTLAQSETEPLRLKLDPGSKTTGMAVMSESGRVVFLGEVVHKKGIKMALESRRALRRTRRSRKTRYRKPRFLNRTRAKGWLPPSLEARVNQTLNAAAKLRNLLPIAAISTEHVKFDTQLMENPEISGVEYQQGELLGYEIREYLLEKWGRKCAYCGAENVPLEIEHIIPKIRGGSNRLSNLAIACTPCNQKKNSQTAEEFGFPEIQAQARKPLRDAAMMNATRWRLFERLRETGLPVECGTGARTKMQRIKHRLPKTHYYDACCVGASTPDVVSVQARYAALWTATGRGKRQMCQTDKYGFPKAHRANRKVQFGFLTGDIVSADVPAGKYQGTWRGRATCRASGQFDLRDGQKTIVCRTNHKRCRLIQRGDGWQYEQIPIEGGVTHEYAAIE